MWLVEDHKDWYSFNWKIPIPSTYATRSTTNPEDFNQIKTVTQWDHPAIS